MEQSAKQLEEIRRMFVRFASVCPTIKEGRYGEFDFDYYSFIDGNNFYYRVNFFHDSKGRLIEIVVNYEFDNKPKRRERYVLDGNSNY